jgi:hypothetical protein
MLDRGCCAPRVQRKSGSEVEVEVPNMQGEPPVPQVVAVPQAVTSSNVVPGSLLDP